MYSVSYCAAIHGIEGCMVQVETDVSNGLPGFSLVGFLSSEVKEARERVQIGMKNAGFHFPPKKITINLSPADIRKGGTGYDLAIAVSVLTAFGYFSQEYIKKFIFIGELSLEGKIQEVPGILPRVYTALENGLSYCVVPEGNVPEAELVEGISVVGASSLAMLAEMLKAGNLGMERQTEKRMPDIGGREADFADVNGQKLVRRAIEVAVAGMHNLLMIGPPGSGKTMLARRIPGIMPELSFEEQMEISKIYSVAGMLSEKCPVVQKRPFRTPHHTITQQALVGGGHLPKPGEVSLANGGVLFLDEFAEFKRQTVEALRQPLEDGCVTISRVDGNYRFPARCQLVAAMNPCQCGYYPDSKRCSCTSSQIKSYLNRVSQPMLDRIDICTETVPLTFKDFQGRELQENEPSAVIRKRVAKAQARQRKRYRKESFLYNAHLMPAAIEIYCVCTGEAQEYLQEAFEKLEFSARAYHKILKVARTIADLSGQEVIQKEHVAEAVSYRMIDKKYWKAKGDF